MIGLNRRKRLLIISIVLIVSAVLISGCTDREPPAGKPPAGTPQPTETSQPIGSPAVTPPQFTPPFTPRIQEPADPNSDIQFVLNDTYAAGETVEVKIRNRGRVSYTFNPYYEACYISYTDSSGRPFLIPPGTHCDVIVSEEIKPGETKTLFKWNLDECVEDRWGCARSEPLPEGTYTLKGKFYSKLSIVSTVTEKSIKIVKHS